MTTDKTEVHLVSGKHEEVEGRPADVAAQLAGGDDLVQLGEIFVSPAHVTHLTGAGTAGLTFGNQ
jgi:hypothetical protein